MISSRSEAFVLSSFNSRCRYYHITLSVGDLSNRRCSSARHRIADRISAPCRAQPASGGSLGLFPAGQQQAKVQLPAVMLMVDAAEVLSGGDVLTFVNEAIAAGATALVLREGGSGGGASQL